MKLFNQSEFKEILTAIKEQIEYDKDRVHKLSAIYGADVMPSDNSRLLNTLFKILHKQFPPEGDFCPIQTFCFDLDFGSGLETKQDPIDDLWEELNKDTNDSLTIKQS